MRLHIADWQDVEYATLIGKSLPEAYDLLKSRGLSINAEQYFADLPLLFYAGQAVHTPDDTEVLRDLSILCSEEEVDSIADALQTNNV